LNIVLSAIKLFLVLGLGLIFLLGQGWLVIGPIIHGSLINQRKEIPLLQEIPLMLMSGLIINYGIVLLFQSLTNSLRVGGMTSIFGIGCFIIYYFRYHKAQILSPSTRNKWIGIALICFLFLCPILSDPLSDWDARSIWFFHAKMIYAANSIGQLAGWNHPSVDFAHADYPNLVPVLAAQVTSVMGFWNEYIPKVSLFLMLVPAVIWVFTFARKSFSFVILILLVPFSFTVWLWNGYMDGYLALYFAVAMLLLGRYTKSSRLIDLISSICCLISLLYIKNEGVVAALIGFCLIIFFHLLQKKPFRLNLSWMNWKYYFAGFIAIIPFVLWGVYKQQLNLQNDLKIGTPQTFSVLVSRLTDGSYKLILQNVFDQINGAFLLLGIISFAAVAKKKAFTKESLPALIAAGLYCLGLIIVYLLTPKDLVWQLDNSINRTMLSVNGCIFIGSYFILLE
jgi:hypothetical protein